MNDVTTEAAGWRVLESRPLVETPWMNVMAERIATPTRPAGVPWTVVHRPVAAVVAPRTADGSYLLVRQERVAVCAEFWEFPAGQVEGAVDETSVLATAHRELGEEAGVSCPSGLVSLGRFFSSIGFTDECAHLFLAPGVVERADLVQHDEHEAIHEVRAFTRDELRAAVADGVIQDANTLAVFARLVAGGLF